MPPPPQPIALDATYSLGRNLSGVGVYSRELLTALAALHPGQPYLWAYRPHRFFKSFQAKLPPNCGRRPLLDNWLPPCGLFHGLNQRLPAARAPRMVVTFHDLFVMTGEYSTPDFRARFIQQAKDAAARADFIICVSAFTAAQAEGLLGVPKSKLGVVWHGVHPVADPPPDAHREPIVLHVGAIQARKNIVRLVEAFELMPPPWRLVLAGSSGYGSAEIVQRIAASPARTRIQVTGYVSDDTLRSLYQKAWMLAFPSLDEGFGIPLLEAMAHGLPILTSNRSALAEVAAGSGLLVDPFRSDDIAAGMSRLASDSHLRAELVSAGRQKAACHSWTTAALYTWDYWNTLR
ncbi:MAG: glycosyltransferase family 4 protein [Acidobacteria bacterium]|nr:glycosyltransferase family 4 protein [Acidobacteriota bacterium]